MTFMARTREFIPAEALAKAMQVFWAKGYFGTSIDDVVNATGVSRYGLYSEFGDKNGLFLAALAHYQTAVVRPIMDIIERPDGSLPEIYALFGMVVKSSLPSTGKLGCLIFNSINELAHHDEVTASKIQDIRDYLRLGLLRILGNAVNKGELDADFNVQREADFLFGVLHALPAMARAGSDSQTIENVVIVALSTLDH
jgi:TetR/AcrR family transcriptional repressor of nem operon